MFKLKRTRLKIAAATDVFIMSLAVYAVSQGMEGLASACVAAILTITSSYIFGDSHRKSNV